MKSKIITLMASLFLFGAAAYAQVGMPMTYELMPRPEGGYTHANLQEIRARLISEVEASLTRDSSGDGWIRGTPCSTPNHFLRAFQELHPEHAPQNVGDLPAFLRTLQLVRAQELGVAGEAHVSTRMMCQRAETASPGDELDIRGVTRDIRSEELVWVHPNAGIMMLGDCSNIVAGPAPEPEVVVREVFVEPEQEECVAIVYPANQGDEVRHFLWSRQGDLPYSTCWGLIQANRLTNPPSPCDPCVPGEMGRFLQRNFSVGEVRERNMYIARESGVHILIAPRERMEEHTSVCVDPPDGRRLTSATVEPRGFSRGRRVRGDGDWNVLDEPVTLTGTNTDGREINFRIVATATIPEGAFTPWRRR